MSPSSPRELVMSLDYGRADIRRASEGYIESRLGNTAPDDLPQQGLPTESPYSSEEISQSRRANRFDAPSTPRDRLLPTPELSPMPTHFVFCPCCVEEEGRINETWHMAGHEKMDTQLEYAMAYIEQMKFN
ncbi:hypothetical protein Trco_000068 [Trichoderma cornu-damae]|uniref:Uncharacterized protein n=1 Tax=Trichoderma cornu-damae TaxID=654480 RepID=A0A9P8QWJ2_9HYPO|nr:hypothetical protein Trco_000068 [Trichoderma cornu-damae]